MPTTPLCNRISSENYRWNFLVNTLDGASFGFGMSFFSSEIILPLFVSHFTNSPLTIGLLSFLGWGGVLVPQLFMANAVERAPRKKFFPMTPGFFLERLPIFLLAPMIYLLAVSQPILTLILFFVLYTWHNVGAGVIIVCWQDMIAKVIPVEKRGRLFGIRISSVTELASGAFLMTLRGIPMASSAKIAGSSSSGNRRPRLQLAYCHQRMYLNR